MRVRCDKCGTKALVAASQCPSCGHLLQVRDGFGDLLPLAQCPTCESHYPLRDGECHWCGTKPDEGRRIAPYVWKGVGVVACLGVAWGTWLISRGGNENVATSQLVNQPTGSRTTVVDSGDLSLPPAQLASADTTTPQVATNGSASDGTYAQSASQDTTQAGPAPVEAAPTPETAPPPAAAEVTLVREPTIVAKRTRAPSRAAAATAPRRNVRWSGAVAREWVTIRAAAAHSARFVASIGPDTRVQLGEARGEWRRIRMKGISGWVERAQF